MVTSSIYQQPLVVGFQRKDLQRDYVSGPDCQVYINSVYLDEVAMLRFQLHNSRTTTYGYHSEFADDIIEGKELIQGMISVYLVEDNYIDRRINREVDPGMAALRAQNEQLKLQATGDQLQQGIPPQFRDVLELYAGKAAVSAWEEVLSPLTSEELLFTDPVRERQVVDIKEQIKTILSKHLPGRLNLSNNSGRLTVKRKPKFNDFKDEEFNITVYSGINQEETMVTIIEGCVLDGQVQTIRTTAEPVTANYKFIGRKLNERIHNG